MSGTGIDALLEALAKHRDWLQATGQLAARRLRRAAAEIEAIALVDLRARMADPRAGGPLDDLAGEVAAGRTDAYSAADRLVAALTGR